MRVLLGDVIKKMVDLLTFDAALEESLSFLSELGMLRQLCHEQKEAISTLVHGSGLLAVLSTGFGKSLIFQLLIRVQEILLSKAACTIIVIIFLIFHPSLQMHTQKPHLPFQT